MVPGTRGAKFKAAVGLGEKVRNGAGGFGAAFKTRVGVGSGASRVNMNRGNSQFIEAIPQHSRTSSNVSRFSTQETVKDRFSDFFDRLKADILSKLGVKEKDFNDPYAAARQKQEAQTSNIPDISALAAIDEREFLKQAELRRLSLAGVSAQTGDFNLFEKDPFADPPPLRNPFADPILPLPPTSKTNQSSYVDSIRRSRGQSISRPHEPTHSRYPSMAPSDTESYRSTYMGPNARKKKGRSDPFDLERPDLYPVPVPALPTNLMQQDSFWGKSLGGEPLRDRNYEPSVAAVTAPRTVSEAGTYESRYSRRMSMGGWGDPGPDLGVGNTTSGAGATWFREQDEGELGVLSSPNSIGRGVGKAR
jgi:hypothetical protein